MNDLSKEIEIACKAILSELKIEQPLTMPKLIDILCHDADYREDAVRMAFWSLVNEGGCLLDKKYRIYVPLD